MTLQESTQRAFAHIILSGLLITSIISGTPARAASTSPTCTTPATTYGKGTTSFNFPETSTYRVWSRLKVPDATNNSYYFQFDTGCALVVGDGQITPGQWSWISYQDGNTNSPITITPASGNHTITVIGREPGVELDKLVFALDPTCIPEGLGENCNDAPPPSPSASASPAPSSATPSPTATPTPTSPPTPRPGVPGDANQSGSVGLDDLGLLMSGWNANPGNIDFNADGHVNVYDLSILLSNWNP